MLSNTHVHTIALSNILLSRAPSSSPALNMLVLLTALPWGCLAHLKLSTSLTVCSSSPALDVLVLPRALPWSCSARVFETEYKHDYVLQADCRWPAGHLWSCSSSCSRPSSRTRLWPEFWLRGVSRRPAMWSSSSSCQTCGSSWSLCMQSQWAPLYRYCQTLQGAIEMTRVTVLGHATHSISDFV